MDPIHFHSVRKVYEDVTNENTSNGDSGVTPHTESEVASHNSTNMNPIHIRSIRKAHDEEDPNVFNVTSKSERFKELSPFFPHGDFKVPFTSHTSQTVEGIWQGLKVFKRDLDSNEAVKCIDVKKFDIKNGKNLKRTIKVNGEIAGHFAGEHQPLLGFTEARKLIYIPAYAEQLKRCQKQIDEIKAQWEKGPITLLDYDVNDDFRVSKPLSHASLIKRWLEQGNLDNPDSWTFAPVAEPKPKKAKTEGEPKPKKTKTEGEPKPKKVKTEGEPKPKKVKTEGEPKPKKVKTEGEPKPKKAKTDALPKKKIVTKETVESSSEDESDVENVQETNIVVDASNAMVVEATA